jgi:hypothetical protein
MSALQSSSICIQYSLAGKGDSYLRQHSGFEVLKGLESYRTISPREEEPLLLITMFDCPFFK